MSNTEQWRTAELQDLGEWKTGSTPRRSNPEYWDGDILWVSPKDMKTDRIVTTEDRMTEKALKETNSEIIPPGSIIIVTRSGILEHTLPIAINKKPVTINQDLKALVLSNDVNGEYIYYCLMSNEVDILKNCTKDGTTVASINSDSLYSYEIPVAPPKIQDQLVTKIDQLFSKLDSGTEELRNGKSRLENYKRKILQNSVEGKLTESWRENQSDIEPTDQLLQRTEELRENECGGKYGKLIEPTNIPDGIEIPQNWAWASLSQIGEVSRGKSTHRPRDDPTLFGGKYPFIQTGEVRAANTVLNKYEKTYNEKGLEQSRLWPEGTLCITIAANIGETAILGIDACFPDSVVGFLTNPEYCNVHYVEIYFRTIQRDLERYAPATAQKNINLGTLSDLPIPLPPVEEQNQIVQKIHSALSVIDDNIKTISSELTRAERLQQSILKQAFRSELASQNQDDEPKEIRGVRDSSENKSESQKQATLSEVINDVE